MTTTTDTRDDTRTTNETRLRPIGVGIGLLVIGLLLNIGVGVVATLVFGFDSVLNGGTGFLVSAVLGQGLVFVLAFGYIRWRSQRVPFAVPSTDESLLIVGSVVASVLAASGLTFLRREVLSTPVEAGLAEVIAANPSVAIVVGVLSVVLIAPAEELLFRGAIQGRFRERFGVLPAVLGASLLFAGWHLLNFGDSVLGAVLASAVVGTVSLLWGYAYERTGNFAVPVLTHGLYNMTLMTITYATLTA